LISTLATLGYRHKAEPWCRLSPRDPPGFGPRRRDPCPERKYPEAREEVLLLTRGKMCPEILMDWRSIPVSQPRHSLQCITSLGGREMDALQIVVRDDRQRMKGAYNHQDERAVARALVQICSCNDHNESVEHWVSNRS